MSSLKRLINVNGEVKMATVSEQIQEIYIGLLGRAADKAGLDYWTAEIEAGNLSIEQLRANIVSEQAEYAADLGMMTRVQTVAELYDRLFDREASADELEYWANGDGAAVNVDQLVLALSNGAAAADRLALDNKADAASYYTEQAGSKYSSTDAKAAVASVKDNASVDASKAATDAAVAVDNMRVEFNTGSTDGLMFDGAGNMTYLPTDGEGRINIGLTEWNAGPTTTTDDYTFVLKNQLGEGEEYGATFLTPVITGTGGQAGGSVLDLRFADRLADADDIANTLNNIQVNSMEFALDGVVYTLQSEALSAARDYDALFTAISDAVEALKATNPALEVVSVTQGGTFSTDQYDENDVRTGDQVVGQSILLSANVGDLDRDLFSADVTSADVGGVDSYARAFDQDTAGTDDIIQTNIELDTVGYGSQGGFLNIAGESNSNKGIHQFDVVAENGVWLSGLKSRDTSNNGANDFNASGGSDFLRTINLDGSGYFRIGQQNGNDVVAFGNTNLEDVQDFNGANFDGEINLDAVITNEVISRDLDLVDIAGPSDDNVTFSYTTAASDDQIVLTVAEDVAAHEDFVLEVTTGAGNDVVELDLADVSANQLENQQDLNNITVTTGSGNDVVKTWGEGNVNILTGSGDDVIYTDNEGLMTEAAQWVVHAENTQASDLDGFALGSSLLYRSTVTVTLAGAQDAGASGVTGTRDVNEDADAYDNGFEATATVQTENYMGDQRHVNQAIKDAIQNDSVLSNLLSVADGPDNTLVITSKIDGEFNVDDLEITVGSVDYTSLSTAEQGELQALLGTDSNNPATDATVTAALTAAATAATATADPALTTTDLGADIDGAASGSDSDNVITAGSGDDVIVLGTGATSTEVVVYDELGSGTDTIVNFSDTGASADILDFSAFLGNMTSTSGSTESQAAIGVTAAGTGVVANGVTVLTGFTAVDNQTWANLTHSDLVSALSNNATSYGNLDNADVTVQGTVTNLVGTTRDHVIMVENNANDGEYKVFEVHTEETANGVVFSSTGGLIATIDFGDSLILTDAAVAGAAGRATGSGSTGAVDLPTYALSGAASADEGSTATFTLTTTNVAEGTEVAYTLSGVDAADVDALTGTATVGADGTATISVAVTADQATEGEETLTVTLDGMNTSASTTINDTSVESSLNVVTPDATNTATATAEADAVTFADLTTGNFNVVDFNTTDDKLVLTGLTGADGSTLADLAGDTIGTGVIGVQVNQITGSTFVNLGQDADGNVISIDLAGVTDASLVSVELA